MPKLPSLDPDTRKDWLEHAVGLLLMFLSLVVALGVLVAIGMAIAGWIIDLS